jgi:hypothetical protein
LTRFDAQCTKREPANVARCCATYLDDSPARALPRISTSSHLVATLLQLNDLALVSRSAETHEKLCCVASQLHTFWAGKTVLQDFRVKVNQNASNRVRCPPCDCNLAELGTPKRKSWGTDVLECRTLKSTAWLELRFEAKNKKSK